MNLNFEWDNKKKRDVKALFLLSSLRKRKLVFREKVIRKDFKVRQMLNSNQYAYFETLKVQK